MSGDEYRSGDVVAGIHELARGLDARWPGMHDEPASSGPRRGAGGRFVAVDPPPVPFVRVWPDGSGLAVGAASLARDLVDETGVRATLARHFPAWDLSDNPPLFEEALKAVEEAS